MKIIILGNTGNNINNAYSWFVKTTYEGFTLNGHNVIGVDWKKNSLDTIKEIVYDFKPNIIFTHLTFHHHKKLPDVFQLFRDFKSKGIKMIHTLSDARDEPRYDGDLREVFDFAFVSQLENLDKFKSYWNIPVFFWPYSSLTLNKIPQKNPKFSFQHPLFTGSQSSHKDRSEFIKELRKIMKIIIVKTKSKNDLRKYTPEVSISSKCILGLCTGYDIGGFIDVRPFQYLGCGAFMISRKFKWQEKILPDDIHVLFHSYDNPEIVKELWKIWENKDTSKIREKAFNFIQKYHSSKVRMFNTLNVIMEKQNSVKALIDEI